MTRARSYVVDTSDWIHYFEHGHELLASSLRSTRVFVHPWVVPELELGSGVPQLDRLRIARLPRVAVVSEALAAGFVPRLRGTGIGWVDLHLLAATLEVGLDLMTRDEPLRRAARRVGLRTTR